MTRNYAKSRSRLLALVLFGLCAASCHAVQAEQKFKASEIARHGSDLLAADLDGDGLKDLVLVDDTNLSIFFQDRTQGFTREPQLIYHFDNRASVIWVAHCGRKAESLLVLDGEGVSELDFANRTPPAPRRIIRQPNLVPLAGDGAKVMCLPLSPQTGSDWPLVLIPVGGGLQVWRHDGEWRQTQFIDHTLESSQSPYPGYRSVRGLDLSIGDVNGDGRDDLIVCRGNGTQTVTYSVFLQQSNQLFQQAVRYSDFQQANSWMCWTDLNHDGRMDLIKSVWLNEPSFEPGLPSGKVIVSTYLADKLGNIPAEPQQILRKNDWTPRLPVVDLDGDGLPDLILGYSQLDSREGIRKEITAKQLDYRVRLFFNRPGIEFPKEADSQRDLVLHMDQAEVPLTFGMSRFFELCVRFDGDFNGDGKRDMAVRDHSDFISIYFFQSREKGFSEKPDLKFPCPKQIDGWEAMDLNGDGISDMVVKAGRQNIWQIYTSQK